jgi:adenosylcobinamide kinase / adenosylcobinamide-phosphate guanylyltransferase
MLLIVGAEGAGKRELARSRGYEDKDIADGVWNESPVLMHLEKMVFDAVYSGEYDRDAWLLRLKAKDIVICNEVGSGVIPIAREQRLAREETGRICTLLARDADTVVRMVCGIPMVLKGHI